MATNASIVYAWSSMPRFWGPTDDQTAPQGVTYHHMPSGEVSTIRRAPLFVSLGLVGVTSAYLILVGAPGLWDHRAKPRPPAHADGGARAATPGVDAGAPDAGAPPPPDAAPPPLLAVEDRALCIAEGNVMRRWGRSLKGKDHKGPEVTTFPTPVARLACTTTHACALTEGGDVFCVGYAGEGDLGVLTRERCPGLPGNGLCSTTPVKVPGLPKMVDIEARNGTCGVSEAGKVYCWGGEGPVWVADDGKDAQALPPETIVRVNGLSNIRQVGLGAGFLCALEWGGDVSCMGSNDGGQLGRGTFHRWLPPAAPPDPSDRLPAPVLSLHGVSSLAVSVGHTCALVDGEVYCWGYTELHAIPELPAGDCNEGHPCDTRPRQVVVPNAARIVALASGGWASCVLDALGAVYCWGSNHRQALGPGGEPCMVDRCLRAPQKLLGLPPLTQILLSDQFMCGLTAGRELLCWGDLEEELHVSPTEPAQCKDCVGPLFRLAL